MRRPAARDIAQQALLALVVLCCGCGEPHVEVFSTPEARLTIEELTPGDPRSVLVQASVLGAGDAWRVGNTSDETLSRVLTLRRMPTSSLPGPTHGPDDPSNASVLGTHRVEEGTLEFRPALPLVTGESYQVRFDPSVLPGLDAVEPVALVHYVESLGDGVNVARAPEVVAIYPSGDVVPANHLKFYVLFSEPMRQGSGIFQHLRLESTTRQEHVARPFRHTELWSSDNLRLTLWFHPGRQKTGVNLNVELGAILRAGDTYKLVISPHWRSQRGVELGTPVEKVFRAAAPDHEQPALSTWHFSTPSRGSRAPVRLDFPQPLDWALLQSELSVETQSGERVAGRAAIGESESAWWFQPESPWVEGDYRVAVGRVLEDLAGNSLERPFEVDLSAGTVKRDTRKMEFLPFAITR